MRSSPARPPASSSRRSSAPRDKRPRQTGGGRRRPRNPRGLSLRLAQKPWTLRPRSQGEVTMKAAAAAVAALLLAIPGVVGADATQLGVGYICGAERDATPRAAGAVMLAGVGNGHSAADTANREAQAWYDQGLNLYHAFNHNEAIAAFAKAAALDPACALCEWGRGLEPWPDAELRRHPRTSGAGPRPRRARRDAGKGRRRPRDGPDRRPAGPLRQGKARARHPLRQGDGRAGGALPGR